MSTRMDAIKDTVRSLDTAISELNLIRDAPLVCIEGVDSGSHFCVQIEEALIRLGEARVVLMHQKFGFLKETI